MSSCISMTCSSTAMETCTVPSGCVDTAFEDKISVSISENIDFPPVVPRAKDNSTSESLLAEGERRTSLAKPKPRSIHTFNKNLVAHDSSESMPKFIEDLRGVWDQQLLKDTKKERSEMLQMLEKEGQKEREMIETSRMKSIKMMPSLSQKDFFSKVQDAREFKIEETIEPFFWKQPAGCSGMERELVQSVNWYRA